MDPDSKRFGRGPRELTGAVDLISYFKLLPHHEFFCKRSLPLSISDTHYLHNVVGDTEIRKGKGMQLDQLIQDTSLSRETSSRIQPFDLDALGEAFQLREAAPVDLPPSEKGIPTVAGKSKSESKDKEKKHKKHKDKDKEKEKEHKKHKHRHKDRSKDKDKDKKRDKSVHHDSGADHSKKHHEKDFSRKQQWYFTVLKGVTDYDVFIDPRKGSMMERRNLMTFTNTREASTRAQRLMRLVQ